MSDASPVSLVCWDVLGAAAVDDSVLERAFAEAIATQGVVTGTAAYVRSMVQFDRTRGWPPADVMRILFPEDEIRAQAANLAFERSFRAAAGPVRGAAAAWLLTMRWPSSPRRASRSAWCPPCPGPRSA